MTRPTPTWRAAKAVSVLGVATMALAACGGGNNNAGTGSPQTSAPPPGTTAATSTSPSATGGGGGAQAQADGTLTIGTLLPQTGTLAYLGPPEFAGVDLAIKDINDAGGVLGKDVKKFDADSSDANNPGVAPQSVDRLLGQKVDAIVGAASSSVSLNVLEKITSAGVVQISPANTSNALTTANDRNLYFRTAPPDTLQGRVLGNAILDDGNETVGILALQDAYGEGLATVLEQTVKEGQGEVSEKIIYDPKAPNFAAEVGQIKAADPDAIAVIAFEETKKIIPELQRQGIGPDKKKIYFVDGNLSDYSKDFKSGTLNGVRGTNPGAETGPSFRKRLTDLRPDLKDFVYAPESYDATVLVALAAEAAKSDAGTAIGGKMIDVSKGGEKCKSFKDCKELLASGKDIDYDGVSGPVEWNDKGDPSEAVIGVYSYGSDNKPERKDSVTGNIG